MPPKKRKTSESEKKEKKKTISVLVSTEDGELVIEEAEIEGDGLADIDTVLSKHTKIPKGERDVEIMQIAERTEAIYLDIDPDGEEYNKFKTNPIFKECGWDIHGPIVILWNNDDGNNMNCPAKFTKEDLLTMLRRDGKRRLEFQDTLVGLGAHVIQL